VSSDARDEDLLRTGFRNVVPHGYLELDLGRIWRTVEVYIPALKAVIDGELGPSSQA
jgi:uncharacterized protein with HEPN domain